MAIRPSATPTPVPPPKPVPTPLYSQSSQFRNWRYSYEGLADVRNELNVKAVERVRTMVEEERAQQHAAPSTASASTTDASGSEPPSRAVTPPPAADIEYLTVADELSLVTFYLSQVSPLCGAFKFSEMVQATAISYLKRFYLRNTCMDYHPKNIMLTCVFLATKTENHPISIDSFSAKTKTTPEEILSLEFLVSQSLRFEYKVHHAHLALSGLLLDMQTTSLPIETIQTAYAKAREFIRISRLTDLEFVYAPSQIALACFQLANPQTVSVWLGAKQPIKDAEERRAEEVEREQLVRVLEMVGDVVRMAQETPVDREKVKEVDKRLRWARNPEKDPKSALFKKRKAEEELEREQKASAKAAARPPNNDESVFD